MTEFDVIMTLIYHFWSLEDLLFIIGDFFLCLSSHLQLF